MRLTLRIPAEFTAANIEIDDRVLLSCNGPTAGVFEQEQLAQLVPWTDFSKRIGSHEIALIWKDALRSLAAATLDGNLADTGHLVLSYDEKTPFRLFLSESRKYFDGRRELDIYLVKILQDKEAGDPFTTFLAKAIAVSLAFRSLFLERGSPYSTDVNYWPKEKWKPGINQLLRDLRLLATQSKQAGIFEGRYIGELFGSDQKAIENVKLMMKDLDEQGNKLSSAATEVLAESEPTQARFDAFVKTLNEFRTKTKGRDTPFLTKLLEHLKHLVEEEGQAKATGASGP